MGDARRSDPLAMRVLASLASGGATVAEVATRLGRPVDVIHPILEQAVAEQAVSRLDLDGTATYSLTPRGLEAVGVYQGVQSAVDASGHVDLGAAARMVMQEYDAARQVAEDRAVRDQAGWPADDAVRERVSAALNDAYARGALSREQLDHRTSQALSATTMGDLRAAAEGVVELPPDLSTGSGGHAGQAAGDLGPKRLELNPALLQVRWRRLGLSAALLLLGLFLLPWQPLLAVVVLIAATAWSGWVLRPLLRPGTARVTTR
jgi:hypothetical protein